MAQARYYSATAQPTVLTAGITSATTVINVLAATGFPASTPFGLAVDYNTPSEEIVLVTIQAGTNLTVTRAYDGTSATSHNAGAGVRHTWTAMDGNDSRAHEAASTGVHGLAIGSAVVGVNDTQTLLSKTLTSPAINGTVGGTASYTNAPSFLGGIAAGSSSQLLVDASGNFSTTGIGGRLAKFKAASQSVTNSTVLVNDSDLFFNLPINSTYLVHGLLGFLGSSAGDAKIQFTGPAGAQFRWTGTAQDSSISAGSGLVETVRHNISDGPEQIGTVTGSVEVSAIINGFLTIGGTAGNFQLQFAQNTSDATATQMRLGSYLVLDRIA